MRSLSVSLTGATGFVGGHAARAFLRAGWTVSAIVRPGSRRPAPDGVRVIEAPLERDALARALGDTSLVVHCAALVRAPTEDAFRRVNVDGTRAVVDAANTTGTAVTLISSLAAGGPGTIERPRREADPSAPVNAYGRSKLGAEEVVRTLAVTPWRIIRPCAVYGERDRGFLPLFHAARRGWFYSPTPVAAAFSLIEATDLARAIVAVSTSPGAAGRTFFAAHPVPQTTGEVLSTLSRIYKRTCRPRTIPRPLLGAAAALGDLFWRFDRKFVIDGSRYAELTSEGFVCSVDQLRDIVGFSASTSLEEGFTRTAEWYRREGWIT